MEYLMAQIGRKGLFVMVRYDPLRDWNKFTIHISSGVSNPLHPEYVNERWDTDEPYTELRYYIEKELQEELE